MGLVGTEFSSKCSPFLSVGSLSVRRIWHELLRYQALHGADEGSEWMKQELPWIWGARFFEWALIDAHPALNSGNWAYLAGVGSDPRSFGGMPRRFDLERQVHRYDPQETHRRRWS
jgi:deoxyribodipyrimidine photolyase